MTRPVHRSAHVLSGGVYEEARPRVSLMHIRQVGGMEKYSVYRGDRPVFGTVFNSLEAAEAALERAMAG